MKTYPVNEIFYSLQGEGARAGTPSVFVRFAGCNQTCRRETHGFDCDTEFLSRRSMSVVDVWSRIGEIWPCAHGTISVILTGGEPGLHLDAAFVSELRAHAKTAGMKLFLAIETNGSVDVEAAVLPETLDWITVSPKVAEHAIRQKQADELKYVRAAGQGIPVPACSANFRFLSPASRGTAIDAEALRTCIELCLLHPEWRLTTQAHKTWSVR